MFKDSREALGMKGREGQGELAERVGGVRGAGRDHGSQGLHRLWKKPPRVINRE